MRKLGHLPGDPLMHPERAGFSWKTPPLKDQPHLPAENVQKVSGLMGFPGRKLLMKERENGKQETPAVTVTRKAILGC